MHQDVADLFGKVSVGRRIVENFAGSLLFDNLDDFTDLAYCSEQAAGGIFWAEGIPIVFICLMQFLLEELHLING